VISISHAVAKGVRKPPGALHLCYCLTPMRYAWDLRDAYLATYRWMITTFEDRMTPERIAADADGVTVDIHDRLVAALGSDRDPDVIESLELLYAGALVRAGMGYGSYAEIADRLEKSARLMLT
jgi:hypothetical protein